MHPPMSFWSGPPNKPPHLKPIFFEILREVGGWGVGSKDDPPFFRLQIIFTLGSSKIEVFETYFFHTVIT